MQKNSKKIRLEIARNYFRAEVRKYNVFVKLISSWERPRLAKINFPLHKAEHTCKYDGITIREREKRKADEPSRARLIFGLALLPVGPEEKPLENFSAWQARPEYSSSSNERWRTYPIRFLISVIAVLNNCIPLPPPVSSPRQTICTIYVFRW